MNSVGGLRHGDLTISYLNNSTESLSEEPFKDIFYKCLKQFDYLLCRRNSYPASAKNIPQWDLYQKAGFIKSGKNRMLYTKSLLTKSFANDIKSGFL